MWAPDAGGSSRSRDGLSPRPHTAGSGRRQFSFQNVFHRHHNKDEPASASLAESRDAAHARPGTSPGPRGRARGFRGRGAADGATEEERLGLVKGDSNQQPAGSPAASPVDHSPASDLRGPLSPVRSVSETAVGLTAPPARPPLDAAGRAAGHPPHGSESSPDLRRQPPGGGGVAPPGSAGGVQAGEYATERTREQARDDRHHLGGSGHGGAFL